MDIDFTWPFQMRQLEQASVVRSHGHMPHLLRGLSLAINPDQLVVAPERTVEKQHIGRIELLKQFATDLRNCRHVG